LGLRAYHSDPFYRNVLYWKEFLTKYFSDAFCFVVIGRGGNGS
jgi:hypothetical protein